MRATHRELRRSWYGSQLISAILRGLGSVANTCGAANDPYSKRFQFRNISAAKASIRRIVIGGNEVTVCGIRRRGNHFRVSWLSAPSPWVNLSFRVGALSLHGGPGLTTPSFSIAKLFLSSNWPVTTGADGRWRTGSASERAPECAIRERTAARPGR